MEMESKFPGTCRECKRPIKKGERIDYEKTKGGAAHLMCAGMERTDVDPIPTGDIEQLAERLGFK